MTPKVDVKTIMLEHSLAKVEIYSGYLEKYLAVLCNASFLATINVFDLFCGEGLYADNKKGSPLVGLEKATKVLSNQTRFIPKIHFYFNDNGKSRIDPKLTKIERLREICGRKTYHKNISIQYNEGDFNTILPTSIRTAKNTPKSKSLFFIDPYGYKEIKPRVIKDILLNQSSELLLFLPISAMYRFAEAAFVSGTPGHEPLYLFLLELFGQQPERFVSTMDFIEKLKHEFKKYLTPDELYVDTFTLQRDKTNTYCLFFFTHNARGFEKMLETKWHMDADYGKGFRLGKQLSLFTGPINSNYPQKIKEHLLDVGSATNSELFAFGLENGFLPKHTKESLDFLKKDGVPIVVSPMDEKSAKGYYISYKNASSDPERLVSIGIENYEQYKNRMD